MATESTEEHGKIKALKGFFPCNSVAKISLYQIEAALMLYQLEKDL
jgi:hypothetical protein